MMSSKRTDQNRPQAAEAPGCLPKAHEPQEDGAWRNHHTVFTNAKAGMDGVDKEHVQRVVYEMSKVRTRLPFARISNDATFPYAYRSKCQISS
jgi:hypothetical protein